MSEQAIAIYCFIDDFFLTIGRKSDFQCKTKDAEVLTTALMAALYFYGNQQAAMNYMKQHHKFCVIDKSGFNRRLHKLQQELTTLFYALAGVLKRLNTSSNYLIDSFPVAVCDNIRIQRSKILKDEIYRGRHSSHRRYFYGFRVQVVTTEDGLPVQFYIHAGSFVDITAFQAISIDIPEGSTLYADAGYTSYDEEDLYQEVENITLKVCRKDNAKRKDEPYQAFLKNYYRKRIETTFSEITAHFPKKIHAVTQTGFVIKLILFIFAFTISKIC